SGDSAVYNKKSLVVLLVVLCAMLLMTGCQLRPKHEGIFERYYLTTLNVSNSADVMSAIRDDEDAELISQSESVIASWGEKKKTSIAWFNAIAFDEEDMTAVRKYGFVVDEKTKSYYAFSVLNMRFDAELIMSPDVLEAPYANANAKKIAVIREVLDRFDADIMQITGDSQILDSSSLKIRQVLKGILYQMDHSPALAARLHEFEGMKFDEMNFGKGRVRMLIEGNTIKLKIKVRSYVRDFEDHLDVYAM
ncbi:MAG: hypothetical protein KAR47_21335, partial [Planctomycetes bacterium]|nr:hypothetical protein [Planctomycetota bacterium]